MRAFTVATASTALGVTPKWLDNTLTRFSIDGVTQHRQGVRRRLTPNAVAALHIAIELVRALDMKLGPAIQLAQLSVARRGQASIDLFPGTSIIIDIEAVEHEVGRRLAHAVEVTPVPIRGRPRGK